MAYRGSRYGNDDDRDEEPVLEIQVLSDVVPLDGVDVSGGISASTDGEQWWPEEQPPVPLGRPVVGSTLTAVGVVGTVVAAALPWADGNDLLASRSPADGGDTVVWLLLALGAAAVLGVLALARPRRSARWWGALVAAVGSAVSGWALVGLPAQASIGVGPGVACAALAVLAAGQLVNALSGPVEPGWRWRPAAIATAAMAVVLAAAGIGSSGLTSARNIDATTANAPLVGLTGAAISTVDREVWHNAGPVYAVAGSVVVIAGHTTRGHSLLTGIAVRDLRTGVERWHHYERGWTVREATLTQDGTTALAVVSTSVQTDAVGFDVATGAVRWQERIGSSVNCRNPSTDEVSPIGGCAGVLVTGDGLLFVRGVGSDGILPVEYVPAKTGRAWPIHLATGCRLRGAGADAAGVYVLEQCVTTGFPEAHLLSETAIAYSPSGTELWTDSLALVKGTVAGIFGPVFVRGDVVFVQQEQRYVAIDEANGEQLWTTIDELEPETTVTDGTYLAWSTGIQVVMLNLHTGEQLWEHDWHFPEEADLAMMSSGHLYLVRHTIGPNPYTCARHAVLLRLDATNGAGATDAGQPLPGGAGNDCGPNVEDRSFLIGPLMVLQTGNAITVLAGR
ncbi:MAG TPA: PQQ-binding-like beta-propeller repeat protein [Pseudonocardiaceae bacterium]|nr:PQQ-binding-like beta-propeller repeat protein [Pseudonocardiaceae bacterium]